MAKVINYDHTFGGLSSPIPTSDLDDNFGNVEAAMASLNTFSNYLLDTGAADAYAVTLDAGTSATLTNGLMIQVKIANANTTASTLNFNGTGAKSIKNIDGAATVAGQLPGGGFVTFIYSTSASAWILLTPSPTKVSGNFSASGSITAGTTILTGNPTGGTAQTLRVGSSFSVLATAPNITIQVELAGNIYYLHAKTTND